MALVFFRVQGQLHHGPILISPTAITQWRGFDDIEPIITARAQFDVIFIGTGHQIAHLPRVWVQNFDDQGINAEPMNTPAACRTYNVLLGEGRRVAIAAFALDE